MIGSLPFFHWQHLVETLKQHAYKNTDNFKSIHETSLSCSKPLTFLGVGQSDATEQSLQRFNISTEQEGIFYYSSIKFSGLFHFSYSPCSVFPYWIFCSYAFTCFLQVIKEHGLVMVNHMPQLHIQMKAYIVTKSMLIQCQT